MSLFQAIGLVITLVAVFGYLNSRYVRLPDVIGITAIGMAFSLLVAMTGSYVPVLADWAQAMLASVDFDEVVFHGMLGLLLFAGSLHVNFSDLAGEKGIVATLATVGVVVSTLVVGFGFHFIGGMLGFDVPLIYCLLFGALISPTDPIAVLGILRKVGAPKSLETKIAGESLFNDGVGVVLFLTLLGIATDGTAVSPGSFTALLAREVIGGVIVGLGVGFAGYYLLRSIDSYAVEILITLAMATGGYALAEALHTSAPIAVVLMGLVVGNKGKKYAMSDTTREHLFSFWDLTDELLNLMLFGLIGLEVIALTLSTDLLLPGLIAIPLVLLARFVSVGAPISLMRAFRPFTPHSIKLMTWGGLRGGVSVALALALPPFPGRDAVLGATYAVVLFSILVQALTMAGLVRRLNPPGAAG